MKKLDNVISYSSMLAICVYFLLALPDAQPLTTRLWYQLWKTKNQHKKKRLNCVLQTFIIFQLYYMCSQYYTTLRWTYIES